ncbi:hypothetical protein [Arthrobacter sp. Hiyo1]|uniref:hypothetical protein n=1 Tax=Arthrobacter sp. Hiyo1 TaxID=1588020 RepID=UPI000ABDEB69|nr:hypothetical protein [Arthrobacter sp. Hiyo1]
MAPAWWGQGSQLGRGSGLGGLRDGPSPDALRRPFFVAAVAVFAVVVLAEIGLSILLGGTAVEPVSPDAAEELGVPIDVFLKTQRASAAPPGAGSVSLRSLTGCCCSRW